MFEAFREPFMQLALGASLTVALVGAVLGVYVVLRRVVFVGAALSQLSASGVALAFLLGLSPNPTAFGVTLVAVSLFAFFTGGRRLSQESILGLAYAPLDDAYQMPDVTWKKKYSASQVMAGERQSIAPYLTQLDTEGVAFEVVSFLTRRSYTHLGGKGLDDPLNQGVMIIGGGTEATDLYSGSFQGVRVLADAWYNTNLKAIVVGQSGSIQVPSRPARGYPSNSIVDSGTNSLNLGPKLLHALFAKLPAAQAEMLSNAVLRGTVYTVDDIKLDQWPTLTFVLEGEAGKPDAQLAVPPQNYWQVNAYQVGAVLPAITSGDDGMAILGLPLMNGYFTVFDGEADNHRGVIRFAQAK